MYDLSRPSHVRESPFVILSPEILPQSLERCQLKDVVASKPDKLDSSGTQLLEENFRKTLLFLSFLSISNSSKTLALSSQWSTTVTTGASGKGSSYA